MRWTGRIPSTLPSLRLLLSSGMKHAHPPQFDVGLVIWGGLHLRDPQLRARIPLTR